MVILFGAIWLVVGIANLRIAYKERFMRDLKKNSMSADEYRAAVWIGKLGYAARGIVFLLIGLIILQTIFGGSTGESQSFDGAMVKLAREPNGEILLAAVAIGLILFGVYSALSAKWIKINPRR